MGADLLEHFGLVVDSITSLYVAGVSKISKFSSVKRVDPEHKYANILCKFPQVL